MKKTSGKNITRNNNVRNRNINTILKMIRITVILAMRLKNSAQINLTHYLVVMIMIKIAMLVLVIMI